MKKYRFLTLSAAIVAISFGFAADAKADDGRYVLTNAAGEVVGSVTLKETEKGVLITVEAAGLDENAVHAVHIHETGKCEPDFNEAGGHFNPAEKNHGMLDAKGPHAGDMPNLHTDAQGKVKQEMLNAMITTAPKDTGDGRHSIKDADGSALIIHDKADDYASQPTGDAGGRFACAVLAAPQGEETPE